MANKRPPEFVRNPYNYDADALSEATGLFCPEPTLTQQQFLEEADINYIAEKFMRTGEIPQVPVLPTPGDFQGIWDFQDAMNLVARAKQEFMALPAKVRSRFDNDPQKLLDYIDNLDDTTRPEAEAIGLIKPRKTDEPTTPSPTPPETQGRSGAARAPAAPAAPPGGEEPGRKDG